jgi:hypothetical protein
MDSLTSSFGAAGYGDDAFAFEGARGCNRRKLLQKVLSKQGVHGDSGCNSRNEFATARGG